MASSLFPPFFTSNDRYNKIHTKASHCIDKEIVLYRFKGSMSNWFCLLHYFYVSPYITKIEEYITMKKPLLAVDYFVNCLPF